MPNLRPKRVLTPIFTVPELWRFRLGDHVYKKRGSAWEGHVVGYYSTDLTPEGYCVESNKHPGSVQIYPRGALAEVDTDEEQS